jgi:hypothetical protein
MEKLNAALAVQSFGEWTSKAKGPQEIELKDCSASTNDAHSVTWLVKNKRITYIVLLMDTVLYVWKA